VFGFRARFVPSVYIRRSGAGPRRVKNPIICWRDAAVRQGL